MDQIHDVGVIIYSLIIFIEINLPVKPNLTHGRTYFPFELDNASPHIEDLRARLFRFVVASIAFL